MNALMSKVILQWNKAMYWAVQKNLVKGCWQILDWYCISWELLSASIADTLPFVKILVSGIFHARFAQRLEVNKPVPDKHWWMVCLPLITEQNAHVYVWHRMFTWSRTTTLSLRNIKPMFDSNLWPSSFARPSSNYYSTNITARTGKSSFILMIFIAAVYSQGGITSDRT